MDRTTAMAIGASVGLVVGCIGAFNYHYNNAFGGTSKSEIVISWLAIPPVAGGAIGYFASK
jgi:hypothetical protein